MNSINIEIFCTPNCNRCGRAVELIQSVISEMDTSAIHWKKLSVVDEIDKAVNLGIRATPAIVINNRLEFTGSPDKNSIRKRIEELI